MTMKFFREAVKQKHYLIDDTPKLTGNILIQEIHHKCPMNGEEVNVKFTGFIDLLNQSVGIETSFDIPPNFTQDEYDRFIVDVDMARTMYMRNLAERVRANTSDETSNND